MPEDIPAAEAAGGATVGALADLADLAGRRGYRVGVAESLTSGQLAADLGAGPDASSWFRGGLVAYASQVKFDVLGVTPGRVVTSECARQMASGAMRLLGADAVVATTGVGGPDPEEGELPGTVFVAALVRGRLECEHLLLPGSPVDVLRQTRAHALRLLLTTMRAASGVGASASADDEDGPRDSVEESRPD
jgi:nicotinamide-nucleotide amidase